MFSIKKLNLIPKYKILLKFILYLLIFLIAYLSTPKLLNFSLNSVKSSLKNNNNIRINNISKINYKIFPTPRLSILNSDFEIGDEEIIVSNSAIEIILNLGQILSSNEIHYKKLLVSNGSSKISLDNINQVLIDISKNKKKLIFEKNNIIFLKKDKVFLEINDAVIRAPNLGEKSELNINGKFLDNKITIKLNNTRNKKNLTLKIPRLDIDTSVLIVKDSSGNLNGLLNLEIFNNFLKFNFVKKNNIKLTNGFIRSKLINSSVDGEVAFKPNFFSTLNFELSNFNTEKIYHLVEKFFFSDNINSFSLIKKINGVFKFKSKFKSKFEGRVINKNGEILFEDFKVGSNNNSFSFNARVFEFGKKSKVQFNLIKIINYNRGLFKKIEITGHLIPSNSKVIFDKFLLDENELSVEKTKEYEKIFEDEFIENSLVNIFNKKKINKFFNNLF